MSETTATRHPTRTLASFRAGLSYEQLPDEVVGRTRELFPDRFGSVLVGKGAMPVEALESFTCEMGPDHGSSEVLVSRRRITPLFAALRDRVWSLEREPDVRDLLPAA